MPVASVNRCRVVLPLTGSVSMYAGQLAKLRTPALVCLSQKAFAASGGGALLEVPLTPHAASRAAMPAIPAPRSADLRVRRGMVSPRSSAGSTVHRSFSLTVALPFSTAMFPRRGVIARHVPGRSKHVGMLRQPRQPSRLAGDDLVAGRGRRVLPVDDHAHVAVGPYAVRGRRAEVDDLCDG